MLKDLLKSTGRMEQTAWIDCIQCFDQRLVLDRLMQFLGPQHGQSRVQDLDELAFLFRSAPSLDNLYIVP